MYIVYSIERGIDLIIFGLGEGLRLRRGVLIREHQSYNKHELICESQPYVSGDFFLVHTWSGSILSRIWLACEYGRFSQLLAAKTAAFAS